MKHLCLPFNRSVKPNLKNPHVVLRTRSSAPAVASQLRRKNMATVENLSSASSDSTSVMTPVQFNPLLPEFRQNPYPTYDRLRTEDPVHQSMLPGTWVLSRYADVAMVLRDSRFGRANAE